MESWQIWSRKNGKLEAKSLDFFSLRLSTPVNGASLTYSCLGDLPYSEWSLDHRSLLILDGESDKDCSNNATIQE
jgi:hypothetical protein